MLPPLLQTKTSIPPARPRQVERARLLRLVDDGMLRALTLVVAPAGFGKTTLLTAWAQNGPQPVTWLSLDANDRNPERFLTYLIRALQHILPKIGQTALTLLHSGQAIIKEGTLYSLVNDLADISTNIVLILDDYHLVDVPEINLITQFLIDHRPDNFHIALVARSMPALSLTRLRALDQVVEINADDLRFTDDEVLTFIEESMGLELRTSELKQLVNSAEGWAVGLQLAALALARNAGDWEIPAGETQIFDYLAQEVLRRESADVQDFLLRVSLIDRFCAPLCVALLDDKQLSKTSVAELLAYVEHANLFLFRLDAAGTWYRLHALFADFLRQKFEDSFPGQTTDLYRKASRWFEDQGILDDAVHYAIHAQDFESAADLLEMHYHTIIQNSQQISALREWLSEIPISFMDKRPVLWLIKGWVSIVSIDTIQVRAYVDQFKKLIPPNEMTDIQRGEMKALGILTGIFEGNISSTDEISEAFALISKQDDFLNMLMHLNFGMMSVLAGETQQAIDAFSKILESTLLLDNPLILTMAYAHKAETHTLRGEFVAAEDTFQQAFRYIKESFGGKSFLLGIPHIGYAELLREQNRFDEAQRYAELGVTATDHWNPTAGLDGRVVLARIQAAKGNWEQAYTLLENAIESAKSSETILDDLSAVIHLVRLHLLQGNLSQAVYLSKRYNIQSRSASMPHYLQEMAQLLGLRIKVLDAERDPRGAKQIAENLIPLITDARRRGNKTICIIALNLRAYALQCAGNSKETALTLRQSLKLGAECGYIRIFVDEGPRLRQIIENYRDQLHDINPYLEMLLTIMDAEQTQPILSSEDLISFPYGQEARPLIDPLSKRELEVLRLLCTNLTASEIADQLFVAESTIRTHIKHIYSKLDVNRRFEAVERARELGLL